MAFSFASAISTPLRNLSICFSLRFASRLQFRSSISCTPSPFSPCSSSASPGSVCKGVESPLARYSSDWATFWYRAIESVSERVATDESCDGRKDAKGSSLGMM